MKISKYIPKKTVHVAFGLFIALFVLTQAVIVPSQDTDRQEQADSEKEEVQQLSKVAAVPSSSIQINLDYQSYLLTEVFFQHQKGEKISVEKLILPSTQKALKILFRQIISPNAP
ncbi:MAG: hypothetical protein ABJG47_04040 [Ekhidna sp.]